jgi:hypothetical protein
MGTLMSALAFGLLMGPITSSVVFEWLGYGLTFGFFTLLLFFAAILAQFSIPARINA